MLEGTGSAPISIADYLQQSFNFRYSFMGPVVGILLGFTVFFAGLAVVTLRFMKVNAQVSMLKCCFVVFILVPAHVMLCGCRYYVVCLLCGACLHQIAH